MLARGPHIPARFQARGSGLETRDKKGQIDDSESSVLMNRGE
jgi:hypothetical protein